MSQEEKERKRGRRATLTRDSRNSTYKRRLNRLAQSGPVLYPPIRPPCEGWNSVRSPGEKTEEERDRQTVEKKRRACRTSQNAEADKRRLAVPPCREELYRLWMGAEIPPTPRRSVPHCDDITSRSCEKNARLSPTGHPSLARHIMTHYYNMELTPEGGPLDPVRTLE